MHVHPSLDWGRRAWHEGRVCILLFCTPKRKHGHCCLVQRPCPKGCCLAAGKVGTNPDENDEMTQTQRTLQLMKQATSTIITHFINEEQELQKGLTCPMSTARFEPGLEPTSSESQEPLTSSAQILSTVQQVLKNNNSNDNDIKSQPPLSTDCAPDSWHQLPPGFIDEETGNLPQVILLARGSTGL